MGRTNHRRHVWICAAFILAGTLGFAAAFTPSVEAEPIKNINFQNADVRSVLNFLAEYGGVNMVPAPNVQGQVTLNLKNVEWREALEILAKTYSLTVIEEKENFLRVALTKDYLDEVAERERHNNEQRQIVDLQTRFFSIKHANAKDIVPPVKSILSTRGKVEVDVRTNGLLVTDEPGNLTRLETFIKEMDRETRQVKIAAKLVEVSSDYLHELGVSWQLHQEGEDSRGRDYTNDGSTDGADRLADPFGSYTFSTIQNGWDLEAKIAALVSDGKGKIVAHPEITTVDNKEARIQVGQKVPIKQFSATGDIVITFEEVGTILRCTPHITSDNRILLQMKPERSSFFFDPSGIVINTSNAETNVVVENGQTAVVGGLTTQDEVVTETGIPVLKDLPLIGVLFKSKSTSSESRDLVIFVTPTIVDPALMGAADTEGATEAPGTN
jgi:type IV pilus secretin PilQ/predicted competence protein